MFMLNTTTPSASETIPTRDPGQLLTIIDELQKDNNILRQKVYYLTHKRLRVIEHLQSYFDFPTKFQSIVEKAI